MTYSRSLENCITKENIKKSAEKGKQLSAAGQSVEQYITAQHDFCFLQLNTKLAITAK